MNRRTKFRTLIVFTLLAGALTWCSARLIDWQVVENVERSIRTGEIRGSRLTMYSRRGKIMALRGESLAISEPTRRLRADGYIIENKGRHYQEIARILAKHLQQDAHAIEQKLRETRMVPGEEIPVPSRYIHLGNDLPFETVTKIEQELKAARLAGILIEHDSKRRYPNNSLLCHVIGFANSANVGQQGIERSMEAELRGRDGYRYIEKDKGGDELPLFRGLERAARDGNNVRLTIDLGLQNIVETELDAALEQFRPKMATVVMMRPQTGEILAMASRPDFDPNRLDEMSQELANDPVRSPLINRAIASAFEPGSTFKIVAVSGALDQRLVSANTMIFCENGYFRRYQLEDSHPYGALSVRDVVVKSSNIGACKLAVQLGEEKFYEYVRRYGFGELTGVALPFEEKGILDPPYKWHKTTISRMPMGHEIGVTALQIITAMSAVANGGELMLPQIIHDVSDPEGKVLRTYPPQPVRRVASPEAIGALREALAAVTGPGGTATLARVAGFKVAGKTGTAQAIINKKYSKTKHRTSFVGYLPADQPAFACLVMLDEPTTPPNQDMGGLVCAPIFSRIAEKAARYLGLPPDPDAPSLTTPGALGGGPRNR